MTYIHQQPGIQNHQEGFTLVELAVVMTIIGLLIGGILKGQELMENARVTSTVAQVKGIEAAVTSFRDAYNAMPGDMPQASTRIPGCTVGCDNANTVAAGSGNGVVGSATWGAAAPWNAQGASVTTAAASTEAAETGLFWLHLLQANLLGGTTNQSLTSNQNYAFGITHPAARITGGFAVGNTNGANMPGDPTAGTHGPVGHVIALLLTPTSNITANSAAGAGVITAARAAQLDRKMDDGGPVSGSVQAYGTTATCQGAAAAPGFNEASTSRDCGVVFRIQN